MQFPLSVDPAAYRRILRIRDVVGRYEKRTKRQETIQHLSGYGIVVGADRDLWGFLTRVSERLGADYAAAITRSLVMPDRVVLKRYSGHTYRVAAFAGGAESAVTRALLAVQHYRMTARI